MKRALHTNQNIILSLTINAFGGIMQSNASNGHDNRATRKENEQSKNKTSREKKAIA